MKYFALLNITVSINIDEKLMNKYKYEVIIYWSDDDNAYIAEVPELAGCMADGSTYEEALQNVQVIIEEWIETAKTLGRTIPKPRGKLMYA
jgi:predicted RNase H-like HicB family nuclease